MDYGICKFGQICREFNSRHEAEAELARDPARYGEHACVEELTVCSSCGKEAGLIPASMLDNFGCQHPSCQY